VDELGSQSADFVPAESNIGRLTQLVDSRTYSESGTLDFHSETQSTKNYHNLHQGQSTAAPAIVMPASSTEPIDLPVLEVARPAPGRQQAEQSERIVRSAVTRAQPSGRIDRLEQQTSNASRVRIENSKGERASSPSARALSHKEIGMFSEPTETEPLFGRKTDVTPRAKSTPVPKREMTEQLTRPAAPQVVMSQATDTPTIQVTIGRVEIRATVASAPTRKTSTQKPVMGLDEYLKQRNGSRG
jgi:hypothetical protein